MENVYFYCPICQTRYQSLKSEIKTSKPYYKCRSCASVFSFTFPFQDQPQYEVIQTKKEKTKECSQCGALNYPMDKECYSCRVVFDKESPLLVRKWNKVLEDFENFKTHQEFINECVQFQKIEFALDSYKKLKEAQGGDDSICDLRILELETLKEKTLKEKWTNNKSPNFKSLSFREFLNLSKDDWKSVFKRQDYFHYLQWFIIACAALLIVVGAVNPYYRNLVGFGVLLCVLLFGFEHIKKGRWD
ncbi:MAG TPA: hypothetical protein PLJ21_11955 [Pseudobdellovibrionaceae bacterium]|mgnify:CR=1 FL=1|nr:hypothetical protein [Pseudobdellovibrionaceae bacterium]